ncbi:uncharacterized protein LOC123566596 isoform X1 [Mercenaria mercenaria]|uniref:uncharacterized protein LOC123566596 isoform X1 n=1 Tax=Mercenaria mercenaria TaxID=6596 RepID=UPI00234F06B3|nr:uncharacterized protein LOC123566596 isoform X1 [Mercenaria mercenaria]
MATEGSINTDILSDETFDLLCGVCKHKEKNREAEKYCVECQDYYCLTCVKVHEDIPSLIGHKILGKGKFPSGSVKTPSGSSKTLPGAQTEPCDRHSHNCVDMYCQNHDDVGCGTCMAVDHRLCQDIFYIPDFLKINTTTTTTRDIQQKLKSFTKTLAEHHEKFQSQKQRLLKSRAETLVSVKKFRKEINDRLDELEKNTVDDIEDKYKALIHEIEEGMKQLEKNKANVSSTLDKLFPASKNAIQNFVNVKKAETAASKAAKFVQETKLQISFKDVDFNADDKISSFLAEINVLGKITERMSVDAECKSTVAVSKEEALLQVKGYKEYPVKVQSDKEKCNIVSACTLEDGTIILSDLSNNKLKRLDSSTYSVIDYCDLPNSPWQVCSANKQEVAVCLPGQKEVHFISIGNRMTATNKITTDFVCYGLACTNGNLYISDNDTSVYIYSVSGRKLKQFSKVESGQKLFSDIFSLSVSKDGSKIFVTDWKNGLIILDNSGEVVERFHGSELAGARSCYLTGRGSLLVCGIISKNVLQFRLDGKLIGEVVKCDDKSILNKAICCNQQMSKMIIGREDNRIVIYDLI